MSSHGSVLRAGLLAGLVGAVLAATPFLNMLNYCCCALTVATGVFAAWMLRSDSAGTAGTERCVLAGMTSGVVSALVGIPLGAVLSRAAFGAAHLEGQMAQMMEQLRQSLEGSGQPPPPGFLEAFEAGLRATSGLELNGWLAITALLFAFVQAFFGMLGGLLGALMTRRPPPPAAPPEAPRPPAPPVVPEVAPPELPPLPEVPESSAPAVVDEDGRPDVRWGGPVVEPGASPSGAAASGDDAAAERGEIPADELPLLPRPPDDAGSDRQG